MCGLFVELAYCRETKKLFNRSSLTSPLQVVEPKLLNALYSEIKWKRKLKPMKHFTGSYYLYHQFTAQRTYNINQIITQPT